MATDLDTQRKTTHQRVSFALKNTKLLLPQRNEQLNPPQNQLAVGKSRFTCSVLAGIFNSHKSLV